MTTKLNLVVQLLMGAVLLAGMVLARRKLFRAHAICQSTVVVLNLIPIFYFMAPVFHRAVQPGLPQKLRDSFSSVATAHATFGTIAEVLGIYIILVAGTKLVPAWLRFKNWKRWMRLELIIWWVTIALGLSTYLVWYGGEASKGTAEAPASPRAASNPAPQQAAQSIVTVEIGNFAFSPNFLTVETGTVVVWKNKTGRHTVVADDSSFESTVLAAGEEFRKEFNREGHYQYYCSLHGAAGGKDMSGTITVIPRRMP